MQNGFGIDKVLQLYDLFRHTGLQNLISLHHLVYNLDQSIVAFSSDIAGFYFIFLNNTF